MTAASAHGVPALAGSATEIRQAGSSRTRNRPKPGLHASERQRIPALSPLPKSERQRRSDPKPRVGAQRLPWVNPTESLQPQRGCAPSSCGRNPVGVEILCYIRTQGSLRQPWAVGRNAVGVLRLVGRVAPRAPGFWTAVASETRHRFGLPHQLPSSRARIQSAVVAALCRRTP